MLRRMIHSCSSSQALSRTDSCRNTLRQCTVISTLEGFSDHPMDLDKRKCFSTTALMNEEEELQQLGSKRRNPVLAEVLREGLPLLHETASLIQASFYTRQSLFHHPEEEDEEDSNDAPPGMTKTFHKHNTIPEYTKTPKYKYTVHHVKESAMLCLEELQHSQPAKTVGDWSVQGEPIQILHVHLSASLQHATLYWTLPHTVTDELSPAGNLVLAQQRLDHVLELQQVLNRRWNAQTLGQDIQSHLRRHNKWTKVPVVRFEPATAAMLYDHVIMVDRER